MKSFHFYLFFFRRIPQCDYMKSKNIKESLNQQIISKKSKEKLSTIAEHEQQQHNTRSIQQVFLSHFSLFNYSFVRFSKKPKAS